MNNKKLIILAISIWLIKCSILAQFVYDKRAIDPFIYLKYDSVVFYEIDSKKMIKEDVSKGINLVAGKISDTCFIKRNYIKKIKVLDSTTIYRFESILKDTNTYGGGTTSFIPKYELIFFLKKTIIAWILIDLEGNYLSSSFYISPKRYFNEFYKDENFVSPNEGFSTMGRKKIKELIEFILLIDKNHSPHR